VKIESIICELHPRHAFRIARPRLSGFRNVFVRVEEDGLCGWGEASPNAFYGETAESVTAKLATVSPHLAGLKIRSVADVERTWSALWPILAPSRAAQCAVDLALWDLLARRERTSVAELAWGSPAAPVQTFCTIGLSSAEELAQKLQELRGFPMLKIKSDAAADLEPFRTLREKSSALLAVDANCAWGEVDLCAISPELEELGVRFIEQPLAPGEESRLPRNCGCLPIMADESCVTLEDVENACAHFAGFNIKLVKCGGLTPGLRMLQRGRELGAQVMVGCMLESSLLIAAGAVVAQQADYADLDGAWLLRDDPFTGWSFEAGLLQPPSGDGFGAKPGQEARRTIASQMSRTSCGPS
jgi:L-alanine-DL-glutamate epimerase-like enolase superfamily enzyme